MSIVSVELHGAGEKGIAISLVCDDYGHNLAEINELIGEDASVSPKWYDEAYLKLEDAAGNPYPDGMMPGSESDHSKKSNDRGPRKERSNRQKDGRKKRESRSEERGAKGKRGSQTRKDGGRSQSKKPRRKDGHKNKKRSSQEIPAAAAPKIEKTRTW